MGTNLKTLEQIKNEYDGYYVYIDNCQFDERGNVVAGRVICFEKNKEVFEQQIRNMEVTTATYILPLTSQGKGLNVLPFVLK